MDIEKCFPAFGQIGEEVLFMREKFVQASVQFVLLDHSGIFTKQISNSHCCDTNDDADATRCPGKSTDN